MDTNVIFFNFVPITISPAGNQSVIATQCVCQIPGLAFPPEALCGLIGWVEGTDISLKLIYKQQQFTACFLLITKLFSLTCIMMFYLKDAQYLFNMF